MKKLTEQDLAQFTGSDTLHRYSGYGLVFTEGVKYVADAGEAYWLIDLINSYQPKLMKNSRLSEFQLWELKVDGTRAVITCREDTGEPAAVRQRIEYTDFPLSEITLYVENGVLLLPGEH